MFFITAFLCIIFDLRNAQTCSDSLECESNTISGNNVYCPGDRACKSANIISSSHLYCSGHYGCNLANISSTALSCYGNSGCRAADILSTNGDIHCDGANSCRNSNIIMDGNSVTNSVIRSNGLWGSRGQTFTFKSDMSAKGWYYSGGFESSRDANVYSGQNNVIKFWMYGYEAAQSASFYCESGSSCTLQCSVGACIDTYYYCDENANSCNYYCDDDNYCEINYIGPTINPTLSPTKNPTINPSLQPSKTTTMNPIINPSSNPSLSPFENPTTQPTLNPTFNPTRRSENPTRTRRPPPPLRQNNRRLTDRLSSPDEPVSASPDIF